jgi:hypothetical protein
MQDLVSRPPSPVTRARARLPRATRASYAFLAMCLLSSAPAWAQAPADRTLSAREQADAAFEEARDLLDEGRTKEACDKFELSMSLDPSPGTLLNLGNCYEPNDLVRAIATFERALADAQVWPDAEKKERWTAAATGRLADLTPKVPQLTVRSTDPQARVALDGQMIETGGPLRVNPGPHVLEASAPDKRPYKQELQVSLGQRLDVTIPALEPLAPAAPVEPAPAVASEPPPAPAAQGGQSQFGVLPWILGGGGAVLLGTSLVTGLMASSKAGQLEDECTGVAMDGKPQCPDPSYRDVKESAESLALVTDVLWITGALAAGASITLFVLDDGGAAESGTTVQTGCFDGGCGVLAQGRF